MTDEPTHTALSPHERDVVHRARELVVRVCDEVRADLMTRTGNVAPEMKGDGSPVTSLDVEVNQRIVDAIDAEFPDHAVVSEELGTTHAGEGRWTWIVDPIDGTSNFTAGLPYWCISIGLTLDGEPVLGIVEAPPLGRRYEAVRGEGAWRNGQRISVREPTDWNDPANRYVPLLLTTATARRARPGVRLNARVMGSAALDLCLVADGTGAASISLSPKVWDIAAGALMVTEAGGTYLTLDGTPLLPLRAETEYAGRSAPAAAGPNADYLRRLVDTLVPDGAR